MMTGYDLGDEDVGGRRSTRSKEQGDKLKMISEDSMDPRRATIWRDLKNLRDSDDGPNISQSSRHSRRSKLL